jgi:NAD(P)-dependent dehydrogenase (short-subunit alcohol dehydrogenase family)
MTERGKVAVIAGANSGLGSALCELLVNRGFRVAALGRDAAVRAIATEVPGVIALACDLTIASEVDAAFAVLEEAAGPAAVVVYNAHRLELRPSAEISLEVFEASWRVNCYGAFIVAKRAISAMLAHGGGTIIFTGATGSIRGGQRSGAFASSKFALRGLAQSLARELSPAGIHVAHIVLDGLIWSGRTRARFGPEEQACMSPRAVAAAYLAIIEQERSAWTHELDLRPSVEHF